MSGEPLVDVTGARRRRARARLRRRLGIAAVVIAVLAVIGGAVWVVWGSPWLRVTRVEVTGQSLAAVADIESAAAVRIGEPLVTVDTAAVGQRIVDAVPAVVSAEVRRSWPDALAISVTEWTPSVVIELAGSYVWVAADGHTFNTTEERPDGVMLAQGSLGDENVLATLSAVASSLPESVAAQADHIQASSPDAVTITLRDGRRIVWGSAEDAALKGEVLVPLLNVDARVYDVSAPSHPTTR